MVCVSTTNRIDVEHITAGQISNIGSEFNCVSQSLATENPYEWNCYGWVWVWEEHCNRLEADLNSLTATDLPLDSHHWISQKSLEIF